MESSVRVSCEESEDAANRVTKKVKMRPEKETNGTTEVLMEEGDPDTQQLNFKEALLNIPGLTGEDDSVEAEWIDE